MSSSGAGLDSSRGKARMIRKLVGGSRAERCRPFEFMMCLCHDKRIAAACLIGLQHLARSSEKRRLRVGVGIETLLATDKAGSTRP